MLLFETVAKGKPLGPEFVSSLRLDHRDLCWTAVSIIFTSLLYDGFLSISGSLEFSFDSCSNYPSFHCCVGFLSIKHLLLPK